MNKFEKEKLLQLAKSSNTDALINSLSVDDKKKLNKILNDKQAINAMLKSPEAAEILKMLSGGKNNE